MDVRLDLSTYRLHGSSEADCKTALAFVSPTGQWQYALSLLCPQIEVPALVEIELQIISGTAGFGLNDASLSKYVTEETLVRPDAGRHTVRILIDSPGHDLALIVRNVSDTGERAEGIIYGIRIVSDWATERPIIQGEDLSLLERFNTPGAKAEPGFVVDFLGCRTRAASLWLEARSLSGAKLGVPAQGDYHGDAIEWLGLLRSVSSAHKQWVSIELGAGHGPWSVAGGKAAMIQGIEKIRLYAVEADPDRFRSLNLHFSDNGFAPIEHVLIEGAVGAQAGSSRWQIATDLSEDWGARPLSGADVADYRGRLVEETAEIRVFAMTELLRREPRWDLVHIDVQGDEVALCSSCTKELNDRVRWLIVGTHSRKLDGDMIDLMWQQDWVLEHEMPTTFKFRPAQTLEAMTTIDGTQVWRNPRF